MQYRIFVGKPGAYKGLSSLEFVAAFPDQDSSAEYVRYLFEKPRAKGKEIVIKAVESCQVNSSEGVLVGLISSMGEEIPIDELQG